MSLGEFVISKIIYIVLLFSFSLEIISCRNSEAKWDGTVKIEDRVTIIENRGTGLWGKDAEEGIRFEENLSLGVEEDSEEYMFYGPISIAVDDELNIYVLDIRNFRLSKFDKKGKFIWMTGRQGQGPEEFQALRNLQLSPEGKIVILDNRSILKFFDSDGQFLYMFNLESSFWDFNFLPDGRILFNKLIDGQLGVEADLYSKEGKHLRVFPINYHYGPKLPFLIGTSDRAIRCLGDKVYFSVPDEYEIREYDLDGRILRKIRRNDKLTPLKLFTEEGKLKRITIRDISGPCFRYQSDMLVNSLSLYDERNGRKEVLDFYSDEGKYLGSVELAKNVYLSAIDDEDNFYFIQRIPFPRISRCRMVLE